VPGAGLSPGGEQHAEQDGGGDSRRQPGASYPHRVSSVCSTSAP
jgi:hypothetical protein